jgi:hypothetical protein
MSSEEVRSKRQSVLWTMAPATRVRVELEERVLIDTILQKLDDNADAIRAHTEGLKMQAAAIGNIAEMVSQILASIADRDEPTESPLIDLLKEIVGLSDRHARSLDRIEDRLARLEKTLQNA